MKLLSLAMVVLSPALGASAGRGAQVEPPGALQTAQAAQEDRAGLEHAFLEITTAQDRYFVGEPIHVRIRFGVERDFARMSLVQLFRQKLDVPVQIEAPWIDGLANAQALTTVSRTTSLARNASFALGAGPAEARRLEDRVVDGRAFTVLEYETALVARNSSDITIPATVLRYAYATRFEEDFVQGRIALDRRDVSVRSAPLVVHIVTLPEEDRPQDFGGAVGTFTITAELTAREVMVGESLALAVHIDGDGNLANFDAPHADQLAGFHVRGVLDDHSAPRRTVTYDLAPDDERVDSVPPLRFAYFDPTAPARYRTIETLALPIRVRAAPHSEQLPAATSADTDPHIPARPAHDTGSAAPARDPSRGSSAGVRARPKVVLVLVLLFTIAAGTWFWVRAVLRRRRERAAARTIGHEAARRLQAQLAAQDPALADADVAGALAEYLASRLGCTAAAVIAPDLASRLCAARIPAELGARTAKVLEALFAARYGGPHGAPDRVEIQRLVAELERAF